MSFTKVLFTYSFNSDASLNPCMRNQLRVAEQFKSVQSISSTITSLELSDIFRIPHNTIMEDALETASIFKDKDAEFYCELDTSIDIQGRMIKVVRMDLSFALAVASVRDPDVASYARKDLEFAKLSLKEASSGQDSIRDQAVDLIKEHIRVSSMLGVNAEAALYDLIKDVSGVSLLTSFKSPLVLH